MAKYASHTMDSGTVAEQIARWETVLDTKGWGKKFKSMARRKIEELETEGKTE